MNRIVEYVKADYERVNAILHDYNKNIPQWAINLYYVVVGSIALVCFPLVMIYVRIRVWFMFQKIKKEFGGI